MPEGDTLRKIALRLRETIQGQRVSRFASARPDFHADRFLGQSIVAVESRGKHLLIHFEDGLVHHTHLGREGSWRLRPADPTRRPKSQTVSIIGTPQWDAICERAKHAELLSRWQLHRHPYLNALGPDILASELQFDEIMHRMRTQPTTPLGVILLDQRIVAGIGNIYKSEMLFRERLHPFAPLEHFDEDTLRRLLDETRKWMRRNLSPGRRRTRWGARAAKWVYKREGAHCLKCDDTIRMARQGRLQRSTYFCPTCQGVTESRSWRRQISP